MIRAVALVGRSGSGKTRVLTHLVRLLRKRGLRVGVLKHTHHTMQGGDTLKAEQAGAAPVALAGPGFLTWYETVPVVEALRLFEGKADLVLVEGYKSEASIPRIEVVREREPMVPVTELWACVSDRPRDGVECFGFHELAALAERIAATP